MNSLKTNWLIKHSITVFSCVLIIVLGIAALTQADPVTTSIGENISTNSLTATGLTVDTNTLYVDSTNNRVGVGTITPATALDINGTTTSPIILGGTATTQDLSLQTTSATGEAGADMHFLVGDNGGTEAMTILNNGNVGIGTDAPSLALDVASDSGISIGANNDSSINVSSSNVFFQNNNEDNDILFKINDGGTVKKAIHIDGAINGVFIGNTGSPSQSNGLNMQGNLDVNGYIMVGGAQFGSKTTVGVGAVATGGNAFTFFENSIDTRNREVRIYGYPTGTQLDYASFQIVGTNNDLQIQTNNASGNILLNPTTGNIGIGTDDPSTELEVDGIIQTTPTASRTCDAAAQGGIMYDSDDNHFYGCNGSAWVQLDN